MPTLILHGIECLRPQEITDETRLSISCDRDHHQHWGSQMRRGDRIDLRDAFEPVVFYDYAAVSLSENDRVRDDNLGRLLITAPVEHDEFRDIFLPSDLGEGGATCYRIHYEVRQGPRVRARDRIELLALRCDDAQGRYDRMKLSVNEVLVWGPHEMRTGDLQEFENIQLDFHGQAEVKIEDVRGQKWSRAWVVRADDHPINTPLHHQFSIDQGYTGDAQYTLTFRLRRLPG